MSLLIMAVTSSTAGCGSDNPPTDAAGDRAGSATTGTGSGKYCDRAAAFLDATKSVDVSTTGSVIDGLDAAAVAARAAADVAPVDVRAAHERLASASEALVAGLRARAPGTREELDAASRELTTELTAQYGDLEEETRQIEGFGAEECGLSFE